MQAAFCRIGLVLAIALTLSACGQRDPRLLNISAGSETPDEFGVLPGKPLEAPENYASLPTPTPGAGNITDPTPNADAVAALGGNPAALTRSGVPASDGALLNFANRYGVQPGIRQELAAKDLRFRKGKDAVFLQRWFSGNRYFKAYRRQSLDQYLELERLRAAGVKTPSAPPKP